MLVAAVWAFYNHRLHSTFSIQTLLTILAPASLVFLLGVYDDIRGAGPYFKFTVQGLAAAMLYMGGLRIVNIPVLFGDHPLPWFVGLSFTVLWVLAITNAFNLIDGLDGLAIMPAVMVAAALGIFAYATGNVNFARYLQIPFINGVGEVLIFSATLVGAGLGFLWFNSYPAQVFMGDVGALAIGASLGTIAVIVRQELVLFVMGGVFVLETVSVVLQVASFKLTGKRIFRMAPIHHHFELKGWAEPKVIVRFWIISFVLVLAGLATLKIR